MSLRAMMQREMDQTGWRNGEGGGGMCRMQPNRSFELQAGARSRSLDERAVTKNCGQLLPSE